MTIHSLRSRLSTMSCPLFIRFIIVCSINMNVHLQHSYMGIRGILSRSYKHQIILDYLYILYYVHGASFLSIYLIILKSEWVNE